MTPMERLQAITNKFQQSMNPVRPSQPGGNILSSGPVTTPASARAIANNMSTKQLLQGAGPGAKPTAKPQAVRPISQTVPGATSTKTVLNKPGMLRNLKAFGKGLAPNAMAKGNLLVAGLQFTENALINSGTPYGNKVKAARDQREGALDQIADLGIGGIIDAATGKSNVTIGATKQPPISRSIVNMNKTSYDVSTPEGKRGYEKAQAAELLKQKKAGVIPGQLPADYKETEAAAFREAAAAGDPQTPFIKNITQESPMSASNPIPNMTYESFMRDIGTPQGINVRDPYQSASLPGTSKAEAEVSLPKDGETPAAAQVGNAVKATEDDSRAVNLDPSESADISEGKSSRRRASRSFLDGKMGSMQALRAAEGEMGLVSQGGRKFLRDPNAEGGLREITRDQYRARMDGGDIEAIFGENPAGAGPVAEISAKPTGYDANVSLQSGVKAESDAYIPPSDSQDPIVAGSDNTPIDGETQLKLKANQASGFAQSRLRKSFG